MESILIIVLCVVVIIALFVVMIKQLVSGNKFRDGAQQITVGMFMQDVESIMGQPSYTKTHNDKSIEYIYEKSEWKGFVRGGTKVRRMEIVFSPDKKVISVGKNSNCDMSGW